MATLAVPQPTTLAARSAPSRSTTLAAVATLAARRFALTARTPREIIVPLMTPVLFALVIAPALRDTIGGGKSGLDYMSFVALATVGLLIPLNTMFAGLGVIVDRIGGAPHAVSAIRELDLGVTAISTRPPSLDDVYLRLTGDRIAA